MKKIIAVVTNNDDDIYCFRKELIEALIASGYKVLVSCPDGPKFELMKNITFIHDNPYIDRRGTNPISDFKLMVHYHQLFKKFKPAVVLTYTAKPNVYGSIAAHRLGIPVINNVTGFGSVLNMYGIKRHIITSLFKYAYQKSECIMFQNEHNMNLAIEDGMVKGDCKLIPGSGVNTERFPLQDYPEGGDGKKINPVVFNYIGRVLHDKGVDDYIEVAKRVKNKYPKTEFNIIGFIEPSEESHYKPLLKELTDKDIVIYRGSQNDVKPYIQRAHAIIHPSTYGEGMSNVLLENASSGRFIITTDNPGCQETVEDNKTGFIYHAGDIDALEKAVIRFLELDNEIRKQMGIRGRERVKKMFSRDIVINTYLTKIRELTK